MSYVRTSDGKKNTAGVVSFRGQYASTYAESATGKSYVELYLSKLSSTTRKDLAQDNLSRLLSLGAEKDMNTTNIVSTTGNNIC